MSQQPLVTTASGPVLGAWQGESARFLGIPYAQPPVGDLRFAAPVAPEPWTEPRDATAYGPTAQRRSFGDGPTIIPEPSIPGADILNLNVFTPNPDGAAGLPVLVWIHGGGYIAGCSSSPWYDGAAFNRDGVVVVTIGYRLGIEGFLHLEGAPDNRAVLDWIAALTWVRDNIAAFGGDPAKVTVAGQSAGGGAVQTLLATPSAHGLFRAAISMSGAVRVPQSREDGVAVAARFTERTGLPATAAALRDLGDDDIQDLQDKVNAPGPEAVVPIDLVLAPFADGELVPEQVHDAFRDGSAATVPLMLGATRHEFHMIGAYMAEAPIELAGAVLAKFGVAPEAIPTYLALHEGKNAGELIGEAITDSFFRGPATLVAEARAAHGLPTWLYEFDWTSGSPEHGPAAFHCLDVPFAFDALHAERAVEATGPDAPQALADAVHGSWVAFIGTLDPGADWPAYTPADRATRLWDTEPTVVPDALGAVRGIWTGIPA
ncbi:carboxylesterase/lipase family protein [Uniformispora flossi]|uniref:carboxylesterase/lipase family protein n=1 Tax=Uniformispora flossi TaxID=3390723 RepID=UPI003C2F3E85